ncbi:MAG TPA: hypothetical protein VGK25_10395 [Ignavibacteria bacterium]|jgi:subtilase family serine protease
MKQIFFAGAVLLVFQFFSNSAHAQLSQTFTVFNKTGIKLFSVYIYPSGANSMGFNMLAKERMLNNESFNFIQNIDKSNCLYDVKYFDERGKEYLIKNLDLCTTTLIALSTVDDTKKANKRE